MDEKKSSTNEDVITVSLLTMKVKQRETKDETEN